MHRDQTSRHPKESPALAWAESSPPPRVAFVVEVPRGGRVKWSASGRVDYVSPLASPFNYGSAPAWIASDGEPADVIVLGPRQERGATGSLPVVARVRFVDAGLRDDKWVCGEAPLSPPDARRLRRFFTNYARIKRALHAVTRRPGPTRFEGLDLAPAGSVGVGRAGQEVR